MPRSVIRCPRCGATVGGASSAAAWEALMRHRCPDMKRPAPPERVVTVLEP